jgi:predicted aminopeptidase
MTDNVYRFTGTSLRFFAMFWLALAVLTLTGCSTVSYYGQAISGQMAVMAKRQPLQEALADPALTHARRQRLQLAQEIREFASAELGLPDNSSYRSYVELDRDYVVWNVFAAPELSLEPKRWCPPLVGCIAYRGYFAQDAAERYGAQLQKQGYDVYVAGIAAYSTLGWFDDPLLSTMLYRRDADLAGVLFHELAHQVAFARGDTTFNESFAMTVEQEGVRRWLRERGDDEALEAYRTSKRLRSEFLELLLATRRQLQALYASDSGDAAKRARKHAVFEQLQRDYRKLKASWGGYSGYDRYFAQELNNAHLVPIGSYHELVPAFQALLRQHGNDLPAFYVAVRELAQLPKAERTRVLQQLAGPTAGR